MNVGGWCRYANPRLDFRATCGIIPLTTRRLATCLFFQRMPFDRIMDAGRDFQPIRSYPDCVNFLMLSEPDSFAPTLEGSE